MPFGWLIPGLGSFVKRWREYGDAGNGRRFTAIVLNPSFIRRKHERNKGMSAESRVFNVLFLCTHNSARSLMAEAILNNLAVSRGRFKAHSAGSMPSGKPNPFALSQIERAGLSTSGLRSKSWDEFAVAGAPRLDFVFTVCDNAAQEVCPVWPGQPMTAHWGLPDPSLVEGSDEDKRRAFSDTFHYLSNRINVFVSLPLDKLDKLSLQKKLDEIGKT